MCIRLAEHLQRSTCQRMDMGQSSYCADSDGECQFEVENIVFYITLAQASVASISCCVCMSGSFDGAKVVAGSKNDRIDTIEYSFIVWGRTVRICPCNIYRFFKVGSKFSATDAGVFQLVLGGSYLSFSYT